MDATKLPPNVLRDVAQYIEDNGLARSLNQDPARFLELCSPREILEMWLHWNGIFGYADDIWALTKLLHAQ